MLANPGKPYAPTAQEYPMPSTLAPTLEQSATNAVEVQTPDVVVLASTEKLSASEAGKVAKRAGHLVLDAGDALVVVRGDSALATNVESRRGLRNYDKVMDSFDSATPASIRAACDGAKAHLMDMVKATNEAAFAARRDMLNQAASATGWRRTVLLRMALKGLK
jgi:hypothetical protein